MENVHQTEALIAADKLGEARPLIDALEAHRRDLRGRRGFESMQISRSSEADGSMRVVAESRWRDDATLEDYLAAGDTPETILARHSSILVPDSVGTRRMEGITGDDGGRSVVYERMATALLVPAGCIAFGLAIIYSLSRVYLDVGGNGAVAIAAGVAITILLGAWLIAESPAMPRWQLAAAGSAVVAALAAGTVWAQVHEGPEIHRGGGESVSGEPTPGAQPTSEAPGTLITLDDNVFRYGGEENPTINVPAGQAVTFQLSNEGSAIHNMHVAAPEYGDSPCSPGGTSPCSDPGAIRGGREGTITLNLSPGTYEYRCDYHAEQMKGTLQVE